MQHLTNTKILTPKPILGCNGIQIPNQYQHLSSIPVYYRLERNRSYRGIYKTKQTLVYLLLMKRTKDTNEIFQFREGVIKVPGGGRYIFCALFSANPIYAPPNSNPVYTLQNLVHGRNFREGNFLTPPPKKRKERKYISKLTL